MPIYHLLKGVTFDQAIVEAAGRAYEDLLVDLQLVDRTDPFTEIVARRVIEVVSSGVHGTAEIRRAVLVLLAKPGSVVAGSRFERPGIAELPITSTGAGC